MSTKEKILIGSIVGVIVLALVLLFTFGRKSANPHPYKMTLEVWGPIDDSDAFTQIFDTYRTLNPQITAINYRKISYDTYQKELLDALASGQGPDIFLINSTWLPSFQDKVVPAEATVLNEQTYRQNFVDVVVKDFFVGGKAWGAPLSVNSLGLYYNKDLFNEAGIAAPPSDWNQFVDDVRRLTKINSTNNEIIQSGAALGTTANINRPTDILSLLMLQGGSEIVDQNGRMTLTNSQIGESGEAISPVIDAINFYTQFSRSGSSYYSWNSRMHYNIDAFSEGNLAMLINYSWQRSSIASKSPKLNFDVAPVPQLQGGPQANYANYWSFVVAKNKIASAGITNTIRTTEAWNFIKFLTTKPEKEWVVPKAGLGGGAVDTKFDPAVNYLMKTEQPAARKDLIAQQKTDPKLGVFATGNLIAKSWFQKDPAANEAIFIDMIDNINKGQISINDAISVAAQRIGQTMK